MGGEVCKDRVSGGDSCSGSGDSGSNGNSGYTWPWLQQADGRCPRVHIDVCALLALLDHKTGASRCQHEPPPTLHQHARPRPSCIT